MPRKKHPAEALQRLAGVEYFATDEVARYSYHANLAKAMT